MSNRLRTTKRKVVFFIGCCVVMVLGIWNHVAYRFFYPFITTSSGLSYKAMCLGNKKKAKEGDWIQACLSIKVADKKHNGKLVKGRTLLDTTYQSEPYIIQVSERVLSKKLCDMLCMVEEKQHMVFKCLTKNFFEQSSVQDLENYLKAIKLNLNDVLVIDIKIEKIMTNIEYMDRLEKERVEQAEKDKKAIMAYLGKNNISACSTQTGLFYCIDQPCEGVAITKGKTVKVHYTGKLLDGTIFDTSLESVAKANNTYNANRKYEPLEIKAGLGQVIPGFDEGLLLLKKAQKARFFIPSALAYGKKQLGIIVPNSVLLFEIEVVDVC